MEPKRSIEQMMITDTKELEYAPGFLPEVGGECDLYKFISGKCKKFGKMFAIFAGACYTIRA